MKKLIFNPVEPLKSNRWIIKLNGMDIPPYLFRKYKIYNEGDEIIFKTEFFETIEWSYNIKDIFNIDEVTIEYLSPVGDVINGVKFKTKGINFERKHSYSDDDLMITKLRLIIDVKSLELLYTHISGKPQLSDED
jgi:hypothetical protein